MRSFCVDVAGADADAGAVFLHHLFFYFLVLVFFIILFWALDFTTHYSLLIHRIDIVV